MPPAGYFIDANLLVLLIAGGVDEDIISKHRRLRAFGVEDYRRLRDLFDQVGQMFVTPHTLAETSNLLAQHAEPERSLLFDQLKSTIQESTEMNVAGTVAAMNREFRRIGLTDAALLEVVTAETPLVTVDIHLYLAALSKGRDAAVNFTRLQGA